MANGYDNIHDHMGNSYDLMVDRVIDNNDHMANSYGRKGD